MKLNVDIKLNLNLEEVAAKVKEASRLTMRDMTVAITADAIKGSPVKTGNNRRSIAAEVSGMGLVATGGEGVIERVVDDNKIQGAIYSTSGYGGFLETGTKKMPARPYFKPALDTHFTIEKYEAAIKRYLK